MSMAESAAQRQLIGDARARAAASLREFVDGTAPREGVKVTCSRAADTLERYCADLLQVMLATIRPGTPDDAAWLRTQYLALIVEFGSAIRDAIGDSETRHAAAQNIQYTVLENERRLRPALERAMLAGAPVVDIASPKPADPALPKPAIPSETV